VAVALLVACSGSSSERELKGHRLIWEDREPSAYEFTLTYTSMIGARSALIRVTDGKVMSASPVEGDPPFHSSFDKGVAIDGVYELLRGDLGSADKVGVTYDSTWGFPAEVSVDEESGGVDDEHGYSVRQFIALSGDLPTPKLTLDSAEVTCRMPVVLKSAPRRVFSMKIGGTGQGELRITDSAGRDLVARRKVSTGQIEPLLRPARGTTALPKVARLRLTAGSTVFVDATYALAPKAGRC
jgi:hypothetical protein